MGVPSLSSLPAELTNKILCYLSGPQDLYSVLRANPHLYTGSFSGSKAIILRNVAGNAFMPTALPDALTAVRLHRSWILSPENHGRWKYKRNLAMSLAAHARVAKWTSITLADSIALCQLSPSLEWLIQHSAGYFLKVAQWRLDHHRKTGSNKITSLDSGASSRCLSVVETTRFQRAFLRYMSLQYAMSSSFDSVCITPSFLAQFTPWEIEEIDCVNQYISVQLVKLCENINDDGVEYFDAPHVPYLNGGSDATFTSATRLTSFLSNKDGKLSLNTKSPDCPHVVAHFSSLGFPFLRSLFKADSDHRSFLFKQMLNTKHDLFSTVLDRRLPSTMREIFDKERYGREIGVKLDFEGDGPEKRNFGWLWSNEMQPQEHYHRVSDEDLRSWGYVFWDKDRLDAFGFLEEHPDEVRLWPRHEGVNR